MRKKQSKITKNYKKTHKYQHLLLLFFFIIFLSLGQKNINFSRKKSKKVEKMSFLSNNTFKSGETLKYKISYGRKNKRGGLFFAAHATFSVKDSVINDSTKIYSLSGRGKTTRLFSFFIKVNHQYKSFTQVTSLSTIESQMSIQEGKYHDFEHIIINQDTLLKKANVNDILCSFYKLRTISQKTMDMTDTLFFSYYYDGIVYNSYILNLGKEVVKTKFGKINTIKCAQRLEEGRMFKENSRAFVWVTDDEMHIPVKLEIPVLVGSIYVNLVSSNQIIFSLTE